MFKPGDMIMVKDGVATGNPIHSVFMVNDKDEDFYWLTPLFLTGGDERIHHSYVDRQSVKITMEEIDLLRILYYDR